MSYEDIKSDDGALNKRVDELSHEKSGVEFRCGDVLYGKLRPYLHNWLLPQFAGIALGDFWVLRPKGVDPKILYRLIQSDAFDKLAIISAGSKMPRADWRLVSNAVFSIPPSEPEQCQIGALFRDVDDLITLRQRERNGLLGSIAAQSHDCRS